MSGSYRRILVYWAFRADHSISLMDLYPLPTHEGTQGIFINASLDRSSGYGGSVELGVPPNRDLVWQDPASQGDLARESESKRQGHLGH